MVEADEDAATDAATESSERRSSRYPDESSSKASEAAVEMDSSSTTEGRLGSNYRNNKYTKVQKCSHPDRVPGWQRSAVDWCPPSRAMLIRPSRKNPRGCLSEERFEPASLAWSSPLLPKSVASSMIERQTKKRPQKSMAQRFLVESLVDETRRQR